MSRPRSRAAAGTRRARHLRNRNLPLRLLQARAVLFGQFRPVLSAHGVTEQQWRVMRALLERGALEPRQIGELCCLSSPSLAGVLARMEATHLVLRRRIDHDQRRVLVQLTPDGRALGERMMPRIEAVYRRLEHSVGSDFVARFHRMLDELISSLPWPEP